MTSNFFERYPIIGNKTGEEVTSFIRVMGVVGGKEFIDSLETSISMAFTFSSFKLYDTNEGPYLFNPYNDKGVDEGDIFNIVPVTNIVIADTIIFYNDVVRIYSTDGSLISLYEFKQDSITTVKYVKGKLILIGSSSTSSSSDIIDGGTYTGGTV